MSTTDELVARLRAYAKDQGGWHNIDDTCEEAADAIETLTRERDCLIDQLEELVIAFEGACAVLEDKT
jgi:hypothetical protein